MERVVLFATPHGSHLYGTAHAESDFDRFVVVTKQPYATHNAKSKYAKQTIRGGVDETVVDLTTFLNGCWKGVPQYLEAMFSPFPEMDRIAELRANYRVGTGVLSTYLRTIKSFSFDTRDGGVKKRRHALRLGLNGRDILQYGRFNPRLDEGVAAKLYELASDEDPEKCLDLACRLLYGDATI